MIVSQFAAVVQGFGRSLMGLVPRSKQLRRRAEATLMPQATAAAASPRTATSSGSRELQQLLTRQPQRSGSGARFLLVPWQAALRHLLCWTSHVLTQRWSSKRLQQGNWRRTWSPLMKTTCRQCSPAPGNGRLSVSVCLSMVSHSPSIQVRRHAGDCPLDWYVLGLFAPRNCGGL